MWGPTKKRREFVIGEFHCIKTIVPLHLNNCHSVRDHMTFDSSEIGIVQPFRNFLSKVKQVWAI